jgi:hypothetical protein
MTVGSMSSGIVTARGIESAVDESTTRTVSVVDEQYCVNSADMDEQYHVKQCCGGWSELCE